MEACVCFGHGAENYDKYENLLRGILVELIENYNVSQFYSGGRGSFDRTVSKIIGQLREIYPHIKNTLVYSYIPTGEKRELSNRYTDSVYLLDKYVPPKVAILKTNQRMIDKSKYVLASVWYSWGGASQAVNYAKRKKKEIIDVGYYIDIDKNQNIRMDEANILEHLVNLLRVHKKQEEREKVKL